MCKCSRISFIFSTFHICNSIIFSTPLSCGFALLCRAIHLALALTNPRCRAPRPASHGDSFPLRSPCMSRKIAFSCSVGLSPYQQQSSKRALCKHSSFFRFRLARLIAYAHYSTIRMWGKLFSENILLNFSIFYGLLLLITQNEPC